MLNLFVFLLAVATAAGVSSAPIVSPLRPDLGAVVAGQYIVAFKAGTPVQQGLQRLQRHVRSQVATATAQSASVQPYEVVQTIGDHAGAAASAQAASASQQPASGLQAVVMRISHPSVLAAVQGSSAVATVVPDRLVAAQQMPTCVSAQQLSMGLNTTQISTNFIWRSCNTAKTELRWIGERCGPGMDQISYTAVYAVFKGTNLVARVAGEDCIITPNATATAAWNRLRFGGCGTPPVYAPALPTCIQPAPAAVTATDTSSPSNTTSSSGNCITATINSGESVPKFNVSTTLTTAVRCGSRSVRSVVYIGTPCGPNKEFVQWFKALGPGSCTLVWRSGQVKYNNDLFGSCGIPPGNLPAANLQPLPTAVCPAAAVAVAAPSPSPAPEQPSPSPSPEVVPSPSPSPSDQVTAAPSPSPAPAVAVVPSPAPAGEGVASSPAPAVEQQPAASPSPAPAEQLAASPSPAPAEQLAASPSPASPSPSSQKLLPRIAVVSGDQTPAGVQRIEAATTDGVVNTGGLPVDRQVTVGVMDSGVDATHPDINYVGGLSWVQDSPADVDGLGHGTHIAGIVSAKNNGAGVVGVAPGVPVYSLKVLDSQGRGMLSTVMSALKWVTTVGVTQGIKIVNISLSAFVDPASPDYQRTFDLVCGVFAEASAAGVMVVVAAGNYGTNLNGYLPAGCPTVAAVTALDSDGVGAAGFSNFLPVASSAVDVARVIAAPGSTVLSTVPTTSDPSGYAYMSGTSMAAPHVAGVAANCVMSGACAAGSGAEKLAVIQAASVQRYQLATTSKPYGFLGDAYSTDAGHYYGLLVWSAAF